MSWVAVWLNGNALVLIVALRRGRLVLNGMGDRSRVSWCLTKAFQAYSAWPSLGTMSTGDIGLSATAMEETASSA